MTDWTPLIAAAITGVLVLVASWGGVEWQSRRQLAQSREARVDDARRQAYAEMLVTIYQAVTRLEHRDFIDHPERAPGVDPDAGRHGRALMAVAGSPEAKALLREVLDAEGKCYNQHARYKVTKDPKDLVAFSDNTALLRHAVQVLEERVNAEMAHRA